MARTQILAHRRGGGGDKEQGLQRCSAEGINYDKMLSSVCGAGFA